MDDSNPVINAVEAGHWQRAIDIKDKDRPPGAKVGALYCRKDGEPFPCSTVLAARAQNARRLAAQSRVTHRILTANPAFQIR